MKTTISLADVAPAGFDEETARADIYGLLAGLLYVAPLPELLAAVRTAPTTAPAGGYLEDYWRAVVLEAQARSDSAIADEYETLFGGMGKPEVYLYGSFYVSGFLNEKPLARLRDELAALGLTRDETMSDTEDHFAYLCEVMRYLIAGEEIEVSNLERQRQFFAAHIQPWAERMCDAIAESPSAVFYAAVAEFARAFVNVEAQGFDMLG